MTDPAEHDMIDIELRPVSDIIGRVAALSALTHRGMLEVETGRDAYELETDRFDLVSWAKSDLAPWMEERELALLSLPIGELESDALGDCESALASLSTLSWALGAMPLDALPLTMTSEETELVLGWAPQAWANLAQLERRAEPRSEEQLAAERERWELWHWRAIEVVDPKEEMPEVLDEVRASGMIPVVGNDLATVDGIPFHELGDDDHEEIAWLAGLRLHALNWVCGFGDSWANVPLYPD